MMTYDELLMNAKNCVGRYCHACPVCDGRACGNHIPGPGAKGTGDVAIRNYDAWQKIRINMDTITENKTVDTTFRAFGKEFDIPVFAGPIGDVRRHYGDKYDFMQYSNILVRACDENGIAAFTGDGVNPAIMASAADAIRSCGGGGVPTVKPWDAATLGERMHEVKESGSFAVAMDIDAAGLPFLKNCVPPAGRKSEEELRDIIEEAGRPFIVKGIMTVAGALKARRAGAAAIVVSNHGGRVLDQVPATAEVLPEIAEAVGGSMTILVDGGIRSGIDVFKALALGADGVLIARPFVTAAYGGGREGVATYVDKLREELRDTMFMCGANTLKDIKRSMVRI
jgi:4-hydroxymandelate oxidase